MNHERRIVAMCCLVLGMPGCLGSDVKLGEGQESSSDVGNESASSDETAPADDGATGPTALPGIGAPCDHGLAPGDVPSAKLLTQPEPGCAGDMCLYADIVGPDSDPCVDDAQCNENNPALNRFVCVAAEGTCALSPEYFAERSMCSASCVEDADCATDEDTNCVTGFSCEPMATLGSACCVPVCVCNDDLDEMSADNIREACESNTAEGCCDLRPGNGLCP